MLRYLIIPLTLYPTALAGPIVVGDEELSRLVARVDCDFTSYHEPDKYMDNCPTKNHLTDGVCKDAIPRDPDKNTQCTAFCQEKIAFGYGKEVPFEGFLCDRNQQCDLTESKGFAQTIGWSFSAGLEVGADGEGAAKAAFSIGSTVSWSETMSYTTSQKWSRPEGYDGCGQWTFIPWVVHSCGTLSVAEIGTRGTNGGCFPYTCPISTSTCDKTKIKTTKDWCQTTPILKDDKNLGTPFFIKTDCTTNEPLQDNQPEPYYYPGVSKHDNFKSQWPPPSNSDQSQKAVAS